MGTNLKIMNWFQHLAASTSLDHLEAQLDTIEDLLSRERDGLLRRYVGDLSAAEVARLRTLLAEARCAVAETAEAFNLEAQVTDVRRAIASTLALAWAMLEDTRPSKLRRYGVVDPSLEASLGPHIERHIALIQAMKAVINSGGAREEEP